MTTPDATTLPGARCLNCDAPLTGPYCASCGQKVVRPNPQLREFLSDATHELTSRDGKVAATLQALLAKPGQLTEDFLAGRRARWLTPLGLYLICSAAYFLAGPLVDRALGVEGKQAARVTVSEPDPGAAFADSNTVVLTAEARDALERMGAVGVLGRDRFDRMASDLNAVNRRLGGAVLDMMPKVMFALMPMFALLTWLAWRDSGQRYPAHLYFALHLHAAWFASMVLAELAPLAGSVIVGVIAALGVVVYDTWYAVVAIKRVLGGTAGQLFVRSTVVGLVYGIWMLAAMFIVLAYAILNY